MKDPVIIGALGGSGTRVVARIVQRLGFFIGSRRNESEDAMEFVPFYDRWINPYIRHRLGGQPVDLDLMGLECAESVIKHRSEIPTEEMPWGWKEPRTIYLVPFFHLLYPELTFLHVLRDGRDMAFSSNQNQLRLHGASILTKEEMTLPQPVQSAILWARVNSMAADFAEEHAPDRYLRIVFEDLCHEPQTAVSRIAEFLDADAEVDLAPLVAEITAPASVGRWHACPDASILDEIHRVAGYALDRFSYV